MYDNFGLPDIGDIDKDDETFVLTLPWEKLINRNTVLSMATEEAHDTPSGECAST